MINLLPTELKQNYLYAHRNTKLIGWLIAFGVGLVGLAVIAVGGVVYLHHTTSTYDSQIATSTTSLNQQKLPQVKQNVEDISNSFKLVVQVLSKEILFSKLLKQLAAITPANVNLTNLDISNVQGALDITAVATDFNAATQLQVNLASPANKLFTKADIVSTSCASNTSALSATQSKYPCTVTVRALFAPNNPYLFVNNSSVKTKVSTP